MARQPDWAAGAGLPKVRPAAKNLSTGNGHLDARPLTRGDVERNAKLAQHGACVDHVKIAGLKQKVCVLRGQDPAAVAAEAAGLAGLAGLPAEVVQ